jgi:hypothetical protein
MKKFILIALIVPAIVHGADSWLTRAGQVAGTIAFYPIKVVIEKLPPLIEEEFPGLGETLNTPLRQQVAIGVTSSALATGTILLAPVSLVLIPTLIIALDNT